MQANIRDILVSKILMSKSISSKKIAIVRTFNNNLLLMYFIIIVIETHSFCICIKNYSTHIKVQ